MPLARLERTRNAYRLTWEDVITGRVENATQEQMDEAERRYWAENWPDGTPYVDQDGTTRIWNVIEGDA